MAKLQMQRVSICGLKRDRKKILEQLQALGVVEVQSIEDPELEQMDTLPARQGFEKNTHIAEAALEVLHEYAPAKTSLFDGLKGKELVGKDKFETTIANRRQILEKAKQLSRMDKEVTELRAGIARHDNQIEAMTPWQGLDVPLNYQGTEKTAAIIGTMDNETALEQVYEIIQADNGPQAVDVNEVNRDKDALYLCVICLKEDQERVENSLRMQGFTRPAHAAAQIPAEYIEAQRSAIREKEGSIAEVTGQIESCAGTREELQLVADYYRMRKDKYEVLGTLPQSERTFFITGYTPTRAVELLKQQIGDKYDCILETEAAAEDDDTPVMLNNGVFAGSVEEVVGSYGLPGKDDIDPSKVTSIFYVIFFGLMLSDAAYGAIVFLACLIVIRKFPRMSAAMNKSLHLFMYCGLSTIFWGVMFGGYFGDLVSVVSKTFFGHEVAIAPVWFAPLNDPMKLLIFSMLFGVIHLFTGLGVKGYMCLRDKKYLDFFCDVVLWYVMLIGLIMMLLPSQIFVSMSQMEIVFPPAVNTLAKALAIFGAAGILLMSGRSSKNFGLRIALGAYDLYNITGWISDVLSYSRLLALGLATGVIASVVNQMGSMVGKSVLGVIVFVLAFCVGHVFNMGINLLGAYVHTCRLQYVEFFGKFYEGGGKPFHPFKKYELCRDR